MHKTAQMQKVDQLNTLCRDRMEEKSRWMQAIIQDELRRPLHVDRAEKFPAPFEVEQGVRRDMERIHAHEVSVLSMEQALKAKEQLRRRKLKKQLTAARARKKQGLPTRAPTAAAVDPKRRHHLGQLAAIRQDLARHRKQKEREVQKLIRLQREAPLNPAALHSVDTQVARR